MQRYHNRTSSNDRETACSEEDHTPHAISQETFILLDQFRQLSPDDQQDILLYTKIKARRFRCLKPDNTRRHTDE